MSDDLEDIRMRCVEVAAKFPNAHKDGQAAGVIEMAQKYEAYVLHQEEKKGALSFFS